MDNFCIAVICNNDRNIPWIQDAVSYLRCAFDHAGVKSEFISDLTHNNTNAHPSWYKLMAHRHLKWKYDYCLCWDVDLLPTNKHSVLDIVSEVKLDKFYGCCDTSIIVGGSGSYFIEYPNIVSNFRWNCGLLGIPQSRSEVMEDIYHKHTNSTKPSYEQYHVADYLYRNQHEIVDGDPMNNVMVQSVLDSRSNYLLYFSFAKCLHYSVSNPSTRSSMILDHCSWKERIFGNAI